jgi:hypothetical protein
MGHGNHWECLGGTAEERITQFIPLVCAKGEVGEGVKRTAKWFNQTEAKEEAIIPLLYPASQLAGMVVLVTDTGRKRSCVFTAFPYVAAGAKRRLRILEIRDWGNQVEGELVCESADGNVLVGFFDTHFWLNREKYEIGKEHDFELAGLIYRARCTNEEAIEVTDQKVLAERHAAYGETPERLPDGSLPPQSVHLAGMTGLGPSDKYPDDAEFYCVIGEVSEFELEGVRIFKIIPYFEGEDCKRVPLPGVIFGAASLFKNGYAPKVGDSIGGWLWVQGFLGE